MQCSSTDHCTFDDSFTEDEQRRIHTSLLALDEAVVKEMYYDGEDGPHWHISRVPDEGESGTPNPFIIQARNTAAGIDILGYSVDNLVQQIDKTTRMLRRVDGRSTGG